MKKVPSLYSERIAQIAYLRSFIPDISKKELIMFFYEVLFLGASLVTPLLARYTIDVILKKQDAYLLMIISAVSLVFFIVLAFARYHCMYIKETLRLNFSLSLKKEILRKMFCMPIEAVQKKTLSEKIFRIDNDTENAISVLINIYAQIILPVLRLVSVFLIAFWLNTRITLAVLFLVPLVILRIRYFSKRRQSIQQSWITDRIKVNKTLLDSFMHQIVIRAFAREDAVKEQFSAGYIRNIRLSLKRLRVSAASELIGDIFQKAVMAGVALWCGIQVINKTMSLGGLVSLTMYLMLFMDSIKTIGSVWSGMLVGFISMDNLNAVLREESVVTAAGGAKILSSIDGNISIKDMVFGYDKKSPVLKGVNLEIPKGLRVAIAGPVGSGKTTLVNLMLGILIPWEGGMCIDGVDIKDMERISFLKKIGIALQEPFLFNASIEENIRFYDERISRDDIITSCGIAGVRDFIEQLPRGYDTIIGEGGAALSGGQKQKIAIARAIAKSPAILILDEAMSSLSPHDESLIFDNLRQASSIKTTVIVSHRLSTIKDADRIYLLQDGVIKDTGTHGELLSRNMFYGRLYDMQDSEIAR